MRYTFFILLFIGLLGSPRLSRAQEAQLELYIEPVIESGDPNQFGEDRLPIDLYFTLYSASQIVETTDVVSATITSLNHSHPADVAPSSAPLDVILVLDMSGSMKENLREMQEAAKRAVGQTRENAQINIVTFDDMNRPNDLGFESTGFLGKNEALDHLNGLSINSDYGTCLFDALQRSLDEMQTQRGINAENEIPHRRAIIVFTDGMDRTRIDQPTPCSNHTAQDVIDTATEQETPIYTIGLGEFDSALTTIAEETNGQHIAAGQTSELALAFSSIMSSLVNRWTASARLYTDEGPNNGTLTITLQDGTKRSSSFGFYSRNAHPTPEPSPLRPEIKTFDIVLSDDQSFYIVNVEIGSETLVHKLNLKIFNENNVKISDLSRLFDIEDEITFSTETLDPGQTYTIKLTLIGSSGERMVDEDGEVISQEYEFTFGEAVITTIIPRLNEDTLSVEITVLNLGMNTLDVKLWSVEANLPNSDIRFVPVEDRANPRVYEASICDLSAGEYQIKVTLFNLEKEAIDSAETEPFSLKPSSACRLQQLIATSWFPFLLLFILLLFGGLILYRLIARRRQHNGVFARHHKQQAPDELVITIGPGKYATPTPHHQPTSSAPISNLNEWEEIRPSAIPPITRRRRRPAPVPSEPVESHEPANERPLPTDSRDKQLVLPSPASNLPTAKLILLQEPNQTYPLSESVFTIGRNECDLNLSDPYITRLHARITKRDQVYYIEDLNSSNYTFLNEVKLRPNCPERLLPGTRISLGKRTKILFMDEA